LSPKTGTGFLETLGSPAKFVMGSLRFGRVVYDDRLPEGWN